MACTPCFTTAERFQSRQQHFPITNCNSIEGCANKMKQYAEIHYEPIATTVTCKESKPPKKSLWQRLFGGLSSHKGQDFCSRRGKKKEKCIPVAYENVMCKPYPVEKRKVCKPVCRCRNKPYVCPRSGCYATPKSVCGCHLYFNIENRRRKICGNPATRDRLTIVNQLHKDSDYTNGFSYDINEEPVHDNAAENIRYSSIKETNQEPLDYKKANSTRYSSLSNGWRAVSTENFNGNNRHSSLINRKSTPIKYSYTARKSTIQKLPITERIKSDVETNQMGFVENITESDQNNDIKIGVTFTKEETTFYKANNGIGNCSLIKCENPENETSATNNITDMGFQKSKVKLSVDSCDYQIGNDHQTDMSVVEECLTTKGPQSESLSREIVPLVKKRRGIAKSFRESEQDDQNDEEPFNNYKPTYYRSTSFKTPLTCTVTTTKRKCSSIDLDRRVSEILRKLENIEEKMMCIYCSEKNSMRNNVITCNLRCSDNEKENCYSSDICKKKIRTSNAIIEISQTKSKTQSPPIVCTISETDALNRSLLNTCNTNSVSIKCAPTNKYRQTEINDCSPVTWCHVANALKTHPMPCYCYDCVCKSNSASP